MGLAYCDATGTVGIAQTTALTETELIAGLARNLKQALNFSHTEAELPTCRCRGCYYLHAAEKYLKEQ